MASAFAPICPSCPSLHWPPLFPVLLAAFGVAGVTPATAAPLLNALGVGLTVVLACAWLSKRVRPPLVAVAGLSVALSPPLLFAARFAWTETTFNLLRLLFLTMLVGYLASGRPAVLYGRHRRRGRRGADPLHRSRRGVDC